jgi:hypothetical protein
MRLTSTGLGIGTSLPGTKLDVRADAGSGGLITLVNTSAFSNTNVIETSYTLSNSNTGLATAAIIGVTNPAATGNSYGDIYFKTTNPTSGMQERMRLDSSGNLGLGVVPNSYWNALKAIEVGGAGSIIASASGGGAITIAQNAYFDSTLNWRYRYSSLPVGGYDIDQGVHKWRIAPSGTAGNAITFTQAMTLDAGGNLLVGGTSTIYGVGGRGNIEINGSSNSILALTIAGSSTNASYLYSTSTDLEIAAIGSRFMRFTTNGSERARITSGGILYVNSTDNGLTSALKLSVTGATGEGAFLFKNDAGASQWTGWVWNTATSGDNLFISFLTEGGTGTGRGSITYNRTGGLVAYNTTSDYRAKDILGSVTDSGAIIDALKVYEGKMKGATQSRPMLVAHEAQEVAPYAVTGEKDAVDEDGNPKYQQMDVSSFVPLLIAEIQSLRQRVAQLEGTQP